MSGSARRLPARADKPAKGPPSDKGSLSSSLVPLPNDVRSKLRSGLAVSSPAHCVEELVQNSLDAGSKSVTVSVDLASFKIQVHDDGSGIAKANLEKIASRYMTSKCRTIQDLESNLVSYGYRGEALASLRDMCHLLQIVSRHREDELTWIATFRSGKRCQVEEYYQDRNFPGASITIVDFMSNMPVRRKMISPSLDMEDVVLSVTGIALRHPEVAFHLFNEISKEQVVNVEPVTQHGVDKDVERFCSLYGNNWRRHLKQIEKRSEDSRLTLKGLVASEGVVGRTKQFVYINKRLVKRTVIHKLLSQLFKRTIMCRPPPAKYRSPSKNSAESPTKAQVLQPVFCLQISCPPGCYDMALEPRKTQIQFEDWKTISDFLEKSLTEFFLENHLLPPTLALLQQAALSSEAQIPKEPCDRISLNVPFEISGIVPLDMTSISEETDSSETPVHESISESFRNDIQEMLETEEVVIRAESPQPCSSSSSNCLPTPSKYCGRSDDVRVSVPVLRRGVAIPCTPPKGKRLNFGRLTEKGFSFCDNANFKSNQETEHTNLPQGWISKTLANEKRVFVQVSSGMTVDDIKMIPVSSSSLEKTPETISKLLNPQASSILPQGKTPFLNRKRKIMSEEQSEEFKKLNDEDFLDNKWNPDEEAKDLKNSTAKLVSQWQNPQFKVEKECLEFCKPAPKHLQGLLGGNFQFEKSMFKSLDILGQIDNKFIATVTRDKKAGKETLVLFDQHAVHERIRLETIINENFPQQTTVLKQALEKPISVKLTNEEARLFADFPEKFEKFGIIGQITNETTDVEVTSVPKCFISREVSELKYHRKSPMKDLVANLLKDLIDVIQITRGSSNILPKTLSNVLNSQACRSAVKFGDPLTLKECCALLSELEKCQAPFQCAHGRPGLAPIISLSQLKNLDEDRFLDKTNKRINFIDLHAMIAHLDSDEEEEDIE